MAARLRSDLKIAVKMIHGRYGEFKVLVNDEIVVDGGAKVILGIMPSTADVLEAVNGRLSSAG